MVMEITSSAFGNGSLIPKKYTCDGQDVNPPLEISQVPDGTRSLALIMHDPDAPRSGGWTHWTIFDLEPSLTRIEENSVPSKGVEGLTDSGKRGYGGPCPPSGTPHRYEFRLYALDSKLALDGRASKVDLERAMGGHIIAKAALMGLYGR